MKYLFTILLSCSFYLPTAFAKDCNLSIYKTYVPRSPEKSICDDQNLPAEYAGNLKLLASSLKQFGYIAKTYDQCSLGDDQKTSYLLISQLGDCVQAGMMMNCKLYVALYDNKSKNIVYENTIAATAVGGVTLHLSDALGELPSCQ